MTVTFPRRTSAVTLISSSTSLSRSRGEFFASCWRDVIAKPSGITAVLSSVPSFDGDAPR
jgi:hypothetical protein